MKLRFICLLVIAAASPAIAQPVYDPTRMTCAETRAVIARDRVVILAYTSTRVPGLPLYKRYVANASYCDSKLTALSPVPTRDNPKCGVLVCDLRIRNFDRHR